MTPAAARERLTGAGTVRLQGARTDRQAGRDRPDDVEVRPPEEARIVDTRRGREPDLGHCLRTAPSMTSGPKSADEKGAAAAGKTAVASWLGIAGAVPKAGERWVDRDGGQ